MCRLVVHSGSSCNITGGESARHWTASVFIPTCRTQTTHQRSFVYPPAYPKPPLGTAAAIKEVSIKRIRENCIGQRVSWQCSKLPGGKGVKHCPTCQDGESPLRMHSSRMWTHDYTQDAERCGSKMASPLCHQVCDRKE